MALKGDTSNLLLADLFQTLSQNQQTGLLVLKKRSGEQRKILFTKGGITLFDARAFRAPRIAHLLSASGLVPQNTVDALMQGSDRLGNDNFSSTRLIAALSERDALDEAEGKRIVIAQVREELFDLFACPQMEFEFDESDLGPDSVPDACVFRTEEIIFEAARRLDEWEMIRSTLEELDDFFMARPGTTPAEGDEALHAVLDGTKTIEELADALVRSRFDVARSICRMMQEGTARLASVTELLQGARGLDTKVNGPRVARMLERARIRLTDDDPRLEEMAQLYAAAGANAEAVKCLLLRSSALQKEGNEQAAFDIVKRANQLAPDDPVVLVKLADFYANRGERKAEVGIVTRLAEMSAAANDFDKAVEYGARVAELFPDSPLLDRRFDDWCARCEKRTFGADALSEAVSHRTHPERVALLYEAILRLDATRHDVRRALEGLRRTRRKNRIVVSISGVVAVAAAAFMTVLYLRGMGEARIEGRFQTAESLYNKGELKLAEAELNAILEVAPEGEIRTNANTMLRVLRERIEKQEQLDQNAREQAARERLQQVQDQINGGQLSAAFRTLSELDAQAQDDQLRRGLATKRAAMITLLKEAKERLGRMAQRFRVPDQECDMLSVSAEYDPEFPPERGVEFEKLHAWAQSLPESVADRGSIVELSRACSEAFAKVRPGLDEIKTTLKRNAELDRLSDDYEHILALEKEASYAQAVKAYDDLLTKYGQGSLTGFFQDRRATAQRAADLRASLVTMLAAGDVTAANERARKAVADFPAYVALGSTLGYPVRITSVPEGARVSIDGRDVGATPVDAFAREGRSQRVKVSATGFVAAELTLDASAKPNTHVDLSREGRFDIRLDAAVDVTAAARDGDAFLGARDGVVYRVDLRTGRVTGSCPTQSLAGACRPLVLSGDLVLVPLGEGELVAVRASSMALAWRRPLGATFTGPVVLSGGKAFASLSDGRVIEVDPADGSTRVIASVASTITGGPAVTDTAVVVGTADGQTIAFARADGAQLFASARGSVPVVGVTSAAGTIVAADDGGVVRAYDRNGTTLWERATGASVAAAPTVVEGLVVLAVGDRAVVLDGTTGELRADVKAQDWVASTPALAGGRIYVGDRSGTLTVFDLQTGNTLFRQALGAALRASPVVLPDGILIVASSGRVTLIGA